MAYSDDNSYEKILTRMLGNKLFENMDRRVGSIIYDALAPCALELAQAYVNMDILETQTYLLTATGNNLSLKAQDNGLFRMEATKAIRVAEFKKFLKNENDKYILDSNGEKQLVDMDVPIGTRFAVPEHSEIIFEYTGMKDGLKLIECETLGSVGNEHLGIILPLTPVNNLVQAKIISTYKYGEDTETDDDLRARILNRMNYAAFGGNIPDYTEKVMSIDGVGGVKVFPAWEQNGSVLLSIVDPQFQPITDEFKALLKQEIDPVENTGQGIGTAPIGHYVTITTPVYSIVNIKLSLDMQYEQTAELVKEDVVNVIENYFQKEREKYSQNYNMKIYRAEIISAVLKLPYVFNVKDVHLNEVMNDVIFTDQPRIGEQYLPKLGEVTIA